ncbi:hypothetical protein [Lentiprolixibacter aurantiacus]|uniref:Membrane protein YfhO n=1 Tax=Lentiprolixibacter aurantiacus TaxID=2993939 RepID=A0AAE3SN81_9FLAO|nr:hypothetical protein [Lentiprolixibacter aurantiacus]MCX2719472.1 hypothetical protein [Lentiprolixibacter aurantiacus]
MNKRIPSVFVHFFVLVFLILASLAYFYPVLQGKAISQSDIQQYIGMAKEQNDFRAQFDQEPYWTNSAFGGMPTYQLGANYPHNYVKELDRVLRFLPRPADYLFLYFLGFYILLSCLKVDYRLAVLGALAFGFSTYMIIILGVGHNAKAHAIAYIPMVLGGIILTFRGKYLKGFLLTAIAMALEISANHYQMTYYFMLLVLVLGLAYLIDAIRGKTLRHFAVSLGILIGAVLLSIGMNATGLLATKEYADWSTRGSTELTMNPDGSPKEDVSGLSKEYITQYSYGVAESLNLFVPRLFGGASTEDLGSESKAYQYLTEQGISRSRALDFSRNIPLYWGNQPGVAAPAYVGAVVLFLFFLGIFLVKGKTKWWLLGGVAFSLVLSWGKNFGPLTDFMIDYFPLYNKFRAVSSIQVVLELCVPLLGVLGLARLFDKQLSSKEKLRGIKGAGLILLGTGVALFLAKGMFSFTGLNDSTYLQYYGEEIMTMIRRDREMAYTQDLIRSLVFVILTGLICWLSIKGRLKYNFAILALAVLIAVDLVGVNLRYVNEDDFVRQRQVNEPFAEQPFDREIRKDSTVFRVYDPREGLNGARTSYFHKSIGGYHAAKPRSTQELFDYQIYQGNLQMLNMLNVKYVIQRSEEGAFAVRNPDALGNAWFVSGLVEVNSADREMQQLSTLNVKDSAVINTAKFPDLSLRKQYQKDSLADISLARYLPNRLIYSTSNAYDGLAVFSELYYPQGWVAYVNGIETPHFRVNYALRAIEIPAGENEIEFRFEPTVIETGSQIALAGSLLYVLIGAAGFLFTIRNRRKEEQAD